MRWHATDPPDVVLAVAEEFEAAFLDRVLASAWGRGEGGFEGGGGEERFSVYRV